MELGIEGALAKLIPRIFLAADTDLWPTGNTQPENKALKSGPITCKTGWRFRKWQCCQWLSLLNEDDNRRIMTIPCQAA